MSTRTTGLAGQQQLRSASRGGPNQRAWPSATFLARAALRHGNLIAAHNPLIRRARLMADAHQAHSEHRVILPPGLVLASTSSSGS